VSGAPEIIFAFDDRYPMNINVRDSIAIVIEAKTNTSPIALNIDEKKKKTYAFKHSVIEDDEIFYLL
jgi:hypothetical protein